MKVTDRKEGLVFGAGTTSREREKGNRINEYRSAPGGGASILREDRRSVPCTAKSRVSGRNRARKILRVLF
ncbi:hypothetical protein [Butyricimonas sp.]|uniref:hypothetical protein n=1 Tax=Butyricimonas sp. TaxID=1969738 RepID=UPI0025BEE158|nr:hypothetical protein [Butyricimonas sp.]